ncbi:MAG: AAA family ATPase [Caldilineales bacterium]|nr:AAA family ATPase [Caldilineales bacterium]
MTTLALYSNKGGVGKTTAAVNLAYLAAQSGYTTLLCDLDPQAAATFYFRVKPKLKADARGLVGVRKELERSIKASDYTGLDILPADFSHRNLDITFDRSKRSRQRLGSALKRLRREYDLIVLDCPPTINILAENIFNASDHLLVPVIPTTLSVRTFEQLLSFLAENKHDLKQVSAFFSMVDRRKNLHKQVMSEMYEQFSNVMQNPIPTLSQIELMGVYREPVSAFSPRSAAARAYKALWSELKEKKMFS